MACRCSAIQITRRAQGAPPLLAGAAATTRPRQRRRQSTLVVRALFDLPLNWNHTDWLKVPRGQAQVTLYPWMEAHNRRECMRRWLERELCMSEKQARGVLSRCPALGELDVRLARRRLKQLDKQMGLCRMDAALLILGRPSLLLPPASEVVSFAVGRAGLPWWQ